MGTRRVTVVVLYAHALLGEGIVRLLAAERGLDVVSIPIHEIDTAERALASSPDVVVVERTDPGHAVDLLKLAPAALLIDVGLDAGPSWTYHREEIPNRADGLVDAIRRLRRSARNAAAREARATREARVTAVGAGS